MKGKISLLLTILLLIGGLTVSAAPAIGTVGESSVKVLLNGKEIVPSESSFVLDPKISLITELARKLNAIVRYNADGTLNIYKPNVNMLALTKITYDDYERYFSTQYELKNDDLFLIRPIGIIPLLDTFTIYFYAEVGNLPKEDSVFKFAVYNQENQLVVEGKELSVEGSKGAVRLNEQLNIPFKAYGTYKAKLLMKFKNDDSNLFQPVGEKIIIVAK
ncbi:hypothetical protein L1765_06730 [Microaerobacter geothermalis]|uniref:hypothetical protein n=1 Tax=Microaerobacter geothermalis TaxID=674972 RepID=UPI001F300A25|nr:hypothetical protein [Microaerobacter geothermalis]MCF6093682.1 hypothetical protein [Microaerobacter geothermalis]